MSALSVEAKEGVDFSATINPGLPYLPIRTSLRKRTSEAAKPAVLAKKAEGVEGAEQN